MRLVRSLLQLLVLPCALVGLGVALGAMTRDIQKQAALLGCDPPAGLWIVWPIYAAVVVAYGVVVREDRRPNADTRSRTTGERRPPTQSAHERSGHLRDRPGAPDGRGDENG